MLQKKETWVPINSSGYPYNNALWLVMLEKAYAKFNVNYANLNMRYSMEAIRDLTGKPVLSFMLEGHTDDEVFDAIHYGH